MMLRRLVVVLASFLIQPLAAHAQPTTVGGGPFTLVATGTGNQLFGLVSDGAGRVYVGTNSNDSTGFPVQRFDPALLTGTAVPLQDFGPPVGDADGLAAFGDSIYAADVSEGIRRITVADATDSVFVANVATNDTGSPFVFRPSDGHLFVGLGGLTGVDRIDEYDETGGFVASHTTGTDVETMTYDPSSGLIYYAPFGSEVRAIDPVTDTDVSVGMSSGTIDGGLAFDSLSGLLFVGTANGVNAGLVETIDPSTGDVELFATGFNGCLGILREPVSGDLYFLEASQLYRLPTGAVTVCPTTPLACRGSEQSSLSIKKGKKAAKDKLVWKWTKGESTTPAEFGDPVHTDGVTLCLYAGETPALLASAGIPPDLVKWKATSTKGYKYKDRGGIASGVRSVTLKGGDEGKSKIVLKASGEHLPDVALGSLPPPVVAQLVGASAKPCFGATYDGSSVRANDATKFKASAK